MSNKINYSTTSLLDKYESRDTSYLPMEVFTKNMQTQTHFKYYCDLLYIDKCEGEFPDLHRVKHVRRVFITNCKIKVYPHTPPIPDWIESLSIEFTEINELPRLPKHLRRLYICRSNLERLPDRLPGDIFELILEYIHRIDKLPPLPNKLGKLVCVNTSIRELPPLPEDLYLLYCWDNQLTRLPRIPTRLRYFRCAGNPFSEMPWIKELHGNVYGLPISQVHISRECIETVFQFQEMYYAVRLRDRFKKWLWRTREREAKEFLDPVRLAEFVENVEPAELESTLDRFFSRRK